MAQIDKLKELEDKSEISKNDLLEGIAQRILKMKKHNLSDYEINQMIEQNKQKFSQKLTKGESLDDIAKFDSNEEQKYHELGPGGRMLIKDDRDVLDYSIDLQRSPDILNKAKRKLKKLDDLAKSEGIDVTHMQKNDDQSSELMYEPGIPQESENTRQLSDRNLSTSQSETENSDQKKKSKKKVDKKMTRRLDGNYGENDYFRRLNGVNIHETGLVNNQNHRQNWDTDLDTDAGDNNYKDNHYGDDENSESDEVEAHKISVLEHKMSQKLSKLLNKDDLQRKSRKNRDSLWFVVDSTQKYDMVQGIGKTGFAKVDFTEERILRGMAVYKRLTESIKMHTNWYGYKNSSANMILAAFVSIFVFVISSFLL